MTYILVVAALIAAAVIGDSAVTRTRGFALFLAASAVFAYVFLNYRNRAGSERDWLDDVEPDDAGPPVDDSDVRAVFVFSDDPLPSVFTSLVDAAGDMEAIDVHDGEYDALYTLDGRVVRAATRGQAVILEVSTVRNEEDLRRRLKEWADSGRLTSNPYGDLVTVANELLRGEWDARWPKRPTWLSRRLHGDGPQQI